MKSNTLSIAALMLSLSVAMTDKAAAQDYRYSRDCTPVPPPRFGIFDGAWWRPDYAPNWEPFFRHHVYQYGPLACGPTVVPSAAVISSKY
jgi:hypothetical protein